MIAPPTRLNRVKCGLCEESFEKNFDLEAHVRRSHDSFEKFECDNCGKTFVFNGDLKSTKTYIPIKMLESAITLVNRNIALLRPLGVCSTIHSLENVFVEISAPLSFPFSA